MGNEPFGCASCNGTFYSDAGYEDHPCAQELEDLTLPQLREHAKKNIKDPKRLKQVLKDLED
jgi:hypothetical protein